MKRLLILWLGCWLLGTLAFGLELGGYYENDILGLVKQGGGVGVGDLNRLRLKLDQRFNDSFSFHLEPRYYFLIKSQDLLLTGASDLDQLILDRAYLKYRIDAWSLTAGKQRVAWGSGYIWNPVDIFNPFVLSFTVREEDQSNVQALRLEVPVGEAGGLDGFVVTGQPWDSTARGIRIKKNIRLFDLAFSYVDQGTLGHQIGFDTAGDILKDTGVRVEFARKTPASGEAYIQSVWGCEYTFDNGVGLNLEYYFNGLGSPGMDYLFLSASKIINELTTIKASLLTNLNDNSFLIYPEYTRSLAQDLDLNLGGMILGGPEASEFVPPAAFALLAKFTRTF